MGGAELPDQAERYPAPRGEQATSTGSLRSRRDLSVLSHCRPARPLAEQQAGCLLPATPASNTLNHAWTSRPSSAQMSMAARIGSKAPYEGSPAPLTNSSWPSVLIGRDHHHVEPGVGQSLQVSAKLFFVGSRPCQAALALIVSARREPRWCSPGTTRCCAPRLRPAERRGSPSSGCWRRSTPYCSPLWQGVPTSSWPERWSRAHFYGNPSGRRQDDGSCDALEDRVRCGGDVYLAQRHLVRRR